MHDVLLYMAKYTLKIARKLATTKNGRCISKEYSSMITWECQNNHQFDMTISDLKRGRWCPHPECKNKRISLRNTKITTQHLQKIAKARGGELLSNEYLGQKTPLKWKCANGHNFTMAPTFVLYRHSWCKYCTKYTCEEKCRFIFESCFQKKFIKTRKVLPHRLELDGYCEELKLAFEHNGKQHYQPCFFYNNEKVHSIDSSILFLSNFNRGLFTVRLVLAKSSAAR